jgi:hypothetical protein
MENHFDPYYKWLGIPPRDQPPNYYRLLGIELFESDRDVIDAAANRVMSYLKDLAVGDDAQHSQKLLNEVSRARLCLLNRQKKVEYDTELRAKTGADERHEGVSPPAYKAESTGEPAGPPPSPPPLAPSRAPIMPSLNLKIQEPATRASRRPVRSAASEDTNKADSRTPALVFAIAAVVLLAGVAVGAAIMLRSGKPTTVGRTEPAVPSDSGPPGTSSGDSPVPDKIDPPAIPLETDPGSPPAATGPSETRIDPRPADPPDSWPRLGTGDPESAIDPESATDPESAPSGVKPAPLIPDWGGKVPESKPDLEPGASDLPDLPDFIDPSMPEQDLATPVPIKPDRKADRDTDPEDTPDRKRRPTISVDSPFRDLPDFATLPPVGPSNSSPLVLGPVHLGEQEPCFLKLRGGEKAVRGSQVFSLRNADGGTAERDWEILLNDGGNPTKVAHLSIDAAGDLGFRWEQAAAEIDVSGNLCNCALVLNAPSKPTHVLALRTPVRSDSLVVDMEKSAPKCDLRIDWLPDPSAVYLEIVGVGGSAIQVKPAPVFLVEKGEAWLTVEEAGGLLVLKVESNVRRGVVSLDVTPHFQLDPTAKPELLVVKKIPQELKVFTGRWQELQFNIQRISQALNQSVPALQRQTLQQNLAALQQQEKEYQDQLPRLTQLHTFLEARKNKIELQVRAFRDADTTQIDLLVANTSSDEP